MNFMEGLTNTTDNIANSTPKIMVHLLSFPPLVLPLFFSKKLLLLEPVMVLDNPASSLDCIVATIISARQTIK